MEKDCDDDYFIIPSVCTYREFLDDSFNDSLGDKFFEKMRLEMKENELKMQKKQSLFNTKPPVTEVNNVEKENAGEILSKRKSSSIKPVTKQSVVGSARLLSAFGKTSLKSEVSITKTKVELPSRRSARLAQPYVEENKGDSKQLSQPMLPSMQSRGRSLGPSINKTNSTCSNDLRSNNRRISSLLSGPASTKPINVAVAPKMPILSARAKRAASEPPKPDRSSRTVYNLRQNIQKPDKYEPPVINRAPSSIRRSVSREPIRISQRRANSVGPSDRRPFLPSQIISAPPSHVNSTPKKVGVVTKERIMAMVERLSQPKKKTNLPTH
uniref:Cleavage stimulation factor 50 kDa subunit n=1 Tax=Strongyloides stercoralis TaxID=6248 RepID=A0A0K0DVC2_STRER